MVHARHLALLVLIIGVVVARPTRAQIEPLPRPDTLAAASFGISVAIDDSIAVVGASGAATCGTDAGAVFVYRRHPGPPVTSWSLSARLEPTDCEPGALFGSDVAISGSRVIVSAYRDHFPGEEENAAYVFERGPRGKWQQTARLTGRSDKRDGLFAAGVAVDGNRAVVSTSGDPNGAYRGAVYIFEYQPIDRTWRRTARLTASDPLGAGILGGDVSLDGNDLAVAASTYFARKPGSAYVFRYDADAGRWTSNARVRGVDAFFIDLDVHGTTLLVGEDRAGSDRSGAASVFQRTDTTWSQRSTLEPSIPYESGSFGSAVAVHGNWALITGYDEQLGKEINIDRVVYVFRRGPGGEWHERTILDVGTVDFGAALDLDGQMAIIGSVQEDESGNAYIARLL